MRAKALVIVSVAVFTLLFALSLSWAKGGNAQRQRKQFHRITGGVKSGEITPREFKSLGREQQEIRQSIKKTRADGGVSAREKHRIHKLQDRASRHIYLAKHNGAKPYSRKLHHRLRLLGDRPEYHLKPVPYWFEPTYYGYRFEWAYADPYYSLAWSIRWW
jgi:hypothetical protein